MLLLSRLLKDKFISATSKNDLRNLSNRNLYYHVYFLVFVIFLTLSISYSYILKIDSFRYRKVFGQKQLFNKVSMHSLSMSSVSPGGGGFTSGPSSSKGFIISPSVSTFEDEMLILENFSQIQLGEAKKIGIIGTQELSYNHQQMIELLSYALVLSGNHVFTSGGGNGTNIAVIRGALRACNPDLLTVILPQSFALQPPELQLLLSRVANKLQQPQYDSMDLKEAANMCNVKILSSVDKCLTFVYHDSTSILGPLEDFEGTMDIIKFYLD